MPNTLDVASGNALLPEDLKFGSPSSGTDSFDTTASGADTDEDTSAGSGVDSFSDDTDEDTSRHRSTMIVFPRPGALAGVGGPSGLLAPRARAAATCIKQYTTVLVCNLPLACMVETLLGMLDSKGYSDKVDFVYAPVNVSTNLGVGYAFFNLVSHEQAKQFMLDFDGFDNWSSSLPKKACTVRWSTCQGLDENIARYQNSPIMHYDAPASSKPVLMKDGVRLPFPEPVVKKQTRKPSTLRPRRMKAQ